MLAASPDAATLPTPSRLPPPPPLPVHAIDPTTGKTDETAYKDWLVEWLAYAEHYGDEAPVDPTVEHFTLHYGDIRTTEAADWVLVARVGCPARGRLHVEFLIDPTNPALAAMLAKVTRDVEYYFVEKGEREPWGYAVYHCTTESNLYSKVHWSHIRPGQPAPPRTRLVRVSAALFDQGD